MFKVGDKVRVIKYGHPIYTNKDTYYKMQEYFHTQPSFIEILMGWEHKPTSYSKTPPKYIIWEDENTFTLDMSPEIVGKEGVIDGILGGKYSVYGIKEKHAWYNEEQLELI